VEESPEGVTQMWVNPNSSGNMHSVGKSWRVGEDPPHWAEVQPSTGVS
jgi:hypothetical protein